MLVRVEKTTLSIIISLSCAFNHEKPYNVLFKGAGKTTLLNCLAGRRDANTGVITMNSRVLDKQQKRKISYVLQEDIFLANLTCWETLWVSIRLTVHGIMFYRM